MPNELENVLPYISILLGIVILLLLVYHISSMTKSEKYCGTSLESLLPPKLAVHFYHTEKINLNIAQNLSFVNFIQEKLRNKVIFYNHYVQGDLSSINASPYNALIRVVNLTNNNEVGIPLAITPEWFMNDLMGNRVTKELEMFYKYKL